MLLWRCTRTSRPSLRPVLLAVGFPAVAGSSCEVLTTPLTGACKQTGGFEAPLGCSITSRNECSQLNSRRDRWEWQGTGTTC